MPSRLQRAFLLGCVVAAEEDRSVKVWRSPSKPTDKWPEDGLLPESASSLGVCLSGGGSRSYTAAMGQLRALHDMGVLGKTKYLTGASGGAWAVSAYTFAQTSEDELSDEAFLGTVYDPEDIVLADLFTVDKRSARYSPTLDFKFIIAQEAAKATFNPWGKYNEVWERAVHRVFLEPHGIERDALFSWTEATRDESIARNPLLAGKKWLVPKRRRPYPILTTTVMGPKQYQPQANNDYMFTQSEVTPLYVGVDYAYNITYKNVRSGLKGTVQLGGMVEPIGYDSGGVVSSGLDPSSADGILTVHAPPYRDFSWARATSESSFAPSATLQHYSPFRGDGVSDLVSFFPPDSPEPETQDMVVSDGGNSENSAIYPLLRRRVERIVMFYTPPTSISSRADWDPTERDPVLGEISDAFASLWGIYVNPDISLGGPGYNHEMIFAKETFPRIAAALQDSQASGKGAVTTVELTTVENKRFGIQAGIKTRLTILYLAASTAWEARLSADVREAVQTGKFDDFPFYSTSDVSLRVEKVNLLANLAGWTVKVNADEFNDIAGREDILV